MRKSIRNIFLILFSFITLYVLIFGFDNQVEIDVSNDSLVDQRLAQLIDQDAKQNQDDDDINPMEFDLDDVLNDFKGVESKSRASTKKTTTAAKLENIPVDNDDSDTIDLHNIEFARHRKHNNEHHRFPHATLKHKNQHQHTTTSLKTTTVNVKQTTTTKKMTEILIDKSTIRNNVDKTTISKLSNSPQQQQQQLKKGLFKLFERLK
jgi:hypothetical protein